MRRSCSNGSDILVGHLGNVSVLLLPLLQLRQLAVFYHLDRLVLGRSDQILREVKHQAVDLSVYPVHLRIFAGLVDLVLLLKQLVELHYDDGVVALAVNRNAVVVVVDEEIIYGVLEADL